MRCIRQGPLGLLVAFVSFSLPAAELGEVVVTATRTAQPVDQALAATQVISREQIQRSQAASIDELLRGAAGFSIANSGGSGKLTSFFVRGADADQLLVLLDGVKLGSATAGTAALQNLPLELIDRIEIVRGPRSSLYGSEAVGGVLQIFTRRHAGAVQPEFSAGAGSYGTRQVAAGLHGGGDRAWFNLQAGSFFTNGFNACNGSSTLFAGCFTEEPDRDGYRSRSVALQGGVQMGTGTVIEGNALRARSHVEYDGGFANRSVILQQVAGATLTQSWSKQQRLTVRAGRAWDGSDDYLASDRQSDFRTRRDSATVQFDLPVGTAQTWTVGADLQRDAVTSSTPYDVRTRRNVGVFAQLVGTHGPLRIETSLRTDDNDQFGQHLTGALALGYTTSDALQWVAQVGTGFRAPTFNELYYPFFGNARLDPERSRSIELAAKGHGANLRWRTSLFNTRVTDLIGLDADFVPANIERARVQGMEVEVETTLRAWRIDAATTLLETKSLASGADRGNRLPRRPRFAGHFDVERHFGAALIGMQLIAEGARFDDAANLRRTGAFATLDLRAERNIGRDWRVQARLANLFDKRYQTVAFYNQPGRTGYVTLRYQPARAR
jgi:vitamin B12 transporter